MSRLDEVKEVLKHKRAFTQTALKLKCFNLKHLFHDTDKLILILLVGDRLATKIHRAISTHHERNGIIKDVRGAIIDWECARITKPNKPLNASGTLYNHYSHLKNFEIFKKELDKLGL